jgi:hypothetical protein
LNRAIIGLPGKTKIELQYTITVHSLVSHYYFIFIHSPSQTRTNMLGASTSGCSPHLPGQPSRR